MSITDKNIAAIRADYSKFSLDERDVLPHPIAQFRKWFDEAVHAEVLEPNAMVLSTLSEDGYPSSRVVLLKDIKPSGFSFFTNYHSKKGESMAAHKQVSLLFFWPELQRQVRIEGQAEQLPSDDSDEYFASRPRGSRVGAVASPQSQIIADRSALEARVAEVEATYVGQESIPRPAYWGGYQVVPLFMEFWQGRSSRLHDRIVYLFQDGAWVRQRLAP
ncbi:pyridoxamine 5'-phosphate oxidase [Sphingobacterium griseoflavum]|uniref:Pyridoxine/pyridoxamine 5'-phosphate oxidase n=1 Tax=Sphingobacterium griseoflavum TaxID=1474952 RepID=A0ABQ3HWW1_9SPHI|nr:pyridoxamine 5'-phosphate oxidase [Sphingobacterium griseoflavum]GHE31006.1 pyridoxine/pyridoxamine 5'-phosphate oxidase [Sphingobacterium griseoflavum]